MWKKIQSNLQTFAGAMMIPIILLVLVGFYVGIGSAFTNYILTEGTVLYNIFAMVTRLGFMFMNNLAVWFAVAISFALARKEKGWAAFSGLIMYLCYIVLIQEYAGLQGWNAETTSMDSLLSSGFTQDEALKFNSLWTNSLGIFTYNMGIFSGLIIGLVTSYIHNKFVDTRLPEMFGFFAGTKTVVIISTLVSIPLAVLSYYVWPYINDVLASITGFISTSGLLGTFIFGTLDKLLLPLGLHHLIAFPIEYSSVGGTMEIDGVVYEGVRNIINAQAASSAATGYITRNFTNGRLLFQLAGIPGAAFAMYRLSKKENRRQVASILIPSVFTLAMVGISEPFEYTFLFLAPQLYFLIYAPLCGLCYVLAEITNVSINGTALLFMIPNLFQPQKVHAMSLLYLLPLMFIVFYLAFTFIIKKWDLATPGRLTAEVKLMSKVEYRELNGEISNSAKLDSSSDLETNIIQGFGGKENIKSVTNCATRLRVTVLDPELVAEKNVWVDDLGAIGVTKFDNNYQIVYGVQVQNIATAIKDKLEID